jgi:hypothetical protein
MATKSSKPTGSRMTLRRGTGEIRASGDVSTVRSPRDVQGQNRETKLNSYMRGGGSKGGK